MIFARVLADLFLRHTEKMSIIGKKINPIQSKGSGGGGGGGDTGNGESDNDVGDEIKIQNQLKNSKLTPSTPDDILALTKISDEYLCSPGIKMLSSSNYRSFSYQFSVSVFPNVSSLLYIFLIHSFHMSV